MDKVIAKTKWCSFLCLTVYNEYGKISGVTRGRQG